MDLYGNKLYINNNLLFIKFNIDNSYWINICNAINCIKEKLKCLTINRNQEKSINKYSIRLKGNGIYYLI